MFLTCVHCVCVRCIPDNEHIYTPRWRRWPVHVGNCWCWSPPSWGQEGDAYWSCQGKGPSRLPWRWAVHVYMILVDQAGCAVCLDKWVVWDIWRWAQYDRCHGTVSLSRSYGVIFLSILWFSYSITLADTCYGLYIVCAVVSLAATIPCVSCYWP